MQRKRYAPGRTGSAARATTLLALGLGLALGAGLTGCSAGTAADDIAVDAKAGPAAPVAPPGRYRTLFEPCGAVPPATLKELLPGAAGLPETERAKTYRGTAAVTYDTDRRVGCTWTADTPDLAHRLVLDVERVVSYDPTVSDDARAQEVYARKQSAAGIAAATPPPATATGPAGPTASASASASTSTSTSASSSASASASGSAAGGPASSAPPSGSASAGAGAEDGAAGLEPRLLTGLGDTAFVDDALRSSATSGHQRVVSVVFRTSNVIVTVEYRQRTAASAAPPDSKELQDRAEKLARALAERLEE